jgi:cobalamin biosynthesis protein CobD/CbiB
MNVIAILAALGLEQWRAFQWRSALEHSFIQYARAVERKLNGGTAQHAAIATLVALVPPVLFAAGIYVALHALHPLLGLAWNVTMLYLLMDSGGSATSIRMSRRRSRRTISPRRDERSPHGVACRRASSRAARSRSSR